ncbi:MAG TPA: hypothetical protein PK413_18035, partial [Thermoanaerobaculia bacterium]|nr:hypothetical protein [Thermoanaerobaculia bacterium]
MVGSQQAGVEGLRLREQGLGAGVVPLRREHGAEIVQALGDGGVLAAEETPEAAARLAVMQRIAEVERS